MSILEKVMSFIKPQPSVEATIKGIEKETRDGRLTALGNRNAKVLYVSPTMAMAVQRASYLGYPAYVRFTYIGANIGGSIFNEVIIDQDWELVLPRGDLSIEQQQKESAMIAQWLEDVRCRVAPGGRLRYLQ